MERFNIPIIIGCFLRSFDNYHLKSGKVHLVCSIVNYNKEINMDNLKYMLGIVKSKRYILRIKPDYGITGKKNQRIEHSAYLIECVLTINQFLHHLEKIDNLYTIFENLFGDRSSTSKDFDSLSNSTLFVFENIE